MIGKISLLQSGRLERRNASFLQDILRSRRFVTYALIVTDTAQLMKNSRTISTS